MRHLSAAVVLSLATFCGLAGLRTRRPRSPAAPAPEAPPGLELSATADAAEVTVGSLARVTVKLKNAGQSPLDLIQLAEDRQVVSFDVQLDGGPVFTYEEIHPNPYKPKLDWPRAKLAPGDTWELSVPFPALSEGELTITAHYGRTPADALEAKPPHLTAAPLKLRIVPSNGLGEVSVEMVTSMGPVRMRLFPREALGTCLHFARLILDGGVVGTEHQVPFYKGLTFHRIVRGFVIQGGCPFGTGLGDPGYSIPAEFAKPGADKKVPEGLRHVPGRLSMARSGHKDSAGSQFYICVGQAENLDGQYTCFGEVTRGMDVVYTISEVPVGAKDKPLEDVTIESIELRPATGAR